MYHEYFGLTEPAFSIAVNPRYLYMSDQHKEALAHLLYGVQSGGFVLLTGEVGTGKTTIIRSLLEQIPDNTDMAMVLNPMAGVVEMIAGICDELGVEYSSPADKNTSSVGLKQLIDSLYQYLLENHRRGRNTVLLIDEAQLLTAEALEQIRLLTNLETNTQKLLQIILVGQPELNTLLSQPRLRQLAQRITARFHLSPLTYPETQAYIAHRLQVAGLKQERNPFSASIVKKIHRFTGGIPRRINILCERILIGLYGHNKHQVDKSTFNAAAKEVVGNIQDGQQPLRFLDSWLKGSLFLLAAIALVVLLGVAYKNFRPAQEVFDTAQTTSAAASGVVNNEQPSYIIKRLGDAQASLFHYLDIAENPCWTTAESLQCETFTLGTWIELKAINRPAVLTLTTADKFTAYATIIGINEQTATVLDAAGAMQKIPLQALGEKWTGRAFYLWRRPPEFSAPLSLGDSGATVVWLAEQFAIMDKQEKPLTTADYTRALQARVKIFQRSVGLNADGILGERTILKLNEAMAIDKGLLHD